MILYCDSIHLHLNRLILLLFLRYNSFIIIIWYFGDHASISWVRVLPQKLSPQSLTKSLIRTRINLKFFGYVIIKSIEFPALGWDLCAVVAPDYCSWSMIEQCAVDVDCGDSLLDDGHSNYYDDFHLLGHWDQRSLANQLHLDQICTPIVDQKQEAAQSSYSSTSWLSKASHKSCGDFVFSRPTF